MITLSYVEVSGIKVTITVLKALRRMPKYDSQPSMVAGPPDLNTGC